MHPATSYAEEERRMMLRSRLSTIQSRVELTRGRAATEAQAQGDAGGNAAQGSVALAGPMPVGVATPVGEAPPAKTVGGEVSAAYGTAGLALPIGRRGSGAQTPQGEGLPKTPTGVFAGTPVRYRMYAGVGGAVGSLSDEEVWPPVAGGRPRCWAG